METSKLGRPLLVTSPLMLVLNNALPVNSVKDLIAPAKREPKKLNYASADVGAQGGRSDLRNAVICATQSIEEVFRGGQR